MEANLAPLQPRPSFNGCWRDQDVSRWSRGGMSVGGGGDIGQHPISKSEGPNEIHIGWPVLSGLA